MFSFLKDNWVNEYSDDEERYLEYSLSYNKEENKENNITKEEKEEKKRKEENKEQEEVEDNNLIKRIKELEDNNLKFVTQLTNLQSIISTKSSLYLEYKEKYEVNLF